MNILRKPFRYRYDNAVLVIIGINVLVYLAELFLRDLQLAGRLSMFPLAVLRLGWIWQFVTYMFVHDPVSIGHLIFNMFALYVFGNQVERRMGSREFLLYYFSTGILAGFLSFLIYTLSDYYFHTGYTMIRLMGASGAIFAVELAFAAFFPSSLIYIWGIFPLKAPVMVLGFTGLELIFMLTGSGGNVAHGTHLAGFIFGWLYFLVRFGINPWRAMRR